MFIDALPRSADVNHADLGRTKAAVLLAGLAALYIPTYWRLASTIWQGEDGAHGPIVLLVSAYLAWKAVTDAPYDRPVGPASWLLLTLGLAMYALGRSQDILLFEVGSQIPVATAAVALAFGWQTVRALSFPILFLAFMIPLPAGLVDALTGPLKLLVSYIAEHVIHAMGLPIARQGVTMMVGQYQLLVADACSGLNSIFSLAALGILYLHLVRHRQKWRQATLLLSIVPLAIAANAIRVITLILITYWFGDDAGQGFLHGFAGITLFMVALLLLLGLDALLAVIGPPRRAA